MKAKPYTIFIAILFLLCNLSLYGQQDMKGTEFWLTFGLNIVRTYNIVNLQIHIIAGNQTATGNIYFIHLNDSVPFSIAAGTVFTHNLTSTQKQAVYNDYFTFTGIFKDTAGVNDYSVYITSNNPVTAYVLNQFPVSTDATCILPVNIIGSDYYHISYSNAFDAYAVVATQNNTNIYCNDTLMATLSRGEVYYRFSFSSTNPNVMVGNHITADKPVAFFVVSPQTFIPSEYSTADILFEQLSPVPAWGKNFFVPVSWRGRDIVRIVASENRTNISQTGGTIRVVQGGQTTLTNLRAGQWVELDISLDSNGCYIQADRPVGVCTYLASYEYTIDLHPGDHSSDPAQAWLPAIEQRIDSAWVTPIIPGSSFTTYINRHHAMVITPTATKDSTIVKIGMGTEQALSGGIWYDHASGYSFYDIPLTHDTAYFFSNPFGRLIVMGYGTGAAESYYCLLASAMRNLVKTVFYVNDIHYQEIDSGVICEQPVYFRAKIDSNVSTNPGYLKWYINNVEEVAARDQLFWSKTLTPGVYQIKMVVLYKDDITTQTLETSVTIVDLTFNILTTPETCGKENGSIALTVNSSQPTTIQYAWDGLPDTTATLTGLKAGTYKVTVRDTFCIVEKTITVEHIDGPVAEFEANPPTAILGDEIRFTDKSLQGDGKITLWHWNFGDDTESSLQNPAHTYRTAPGKYMVLLKIEDEFGCRDSIEHEVLILKGLDFPNIFSPVGSDGKKYVFRPLEGAGQFKEFTIEIYDRWGVSVWQKQCKDPGCPDYDDSFWWDGTTQSGKQVPDGVYYWVVYAISYSGIKPMIKNGSVTVVSQ